MSVELIRKTIALTLVAFMSLTVFGGLAIALNPLDNNDWDQDPDMDELNNRQEFASGSDPNNWDTDGDGMPDGWEVDNQMDPTDPTDAEMDNDYFGGEEYASYSEVDPPYTNYDEYYRFYGIDAETGDNLYRPTNPNDEDTDGDAILDPDDSWPWDFGQKGGAGGGGGSSAPNPGAPTEPPKDTDGDGILDWYEAFIGTDPFNPDTDGDGLSDPQEIARDLDPNDWDTDNDLLIDGVEEGGGGDSTDGHLQDTDNDGLPDPWEDNDGDGILNIEEQNIVVWWWIFMLPPNAGGAGMDPYYGYLIAYRCASLMGMNPNTNDTDADQISDDKETQAYAPGPINKNSRSEYNYHQVTNETGGGRWIPDRWNREHDLTNPNSGFSVWTDNQFAWYEYWFTKAYEYGELPVNSYSVVLYNINPWLWWYLVTDDFSEAAFQSFIGAGYMHSSAPISSYKEYTTAGDIFGWMEKGAAPNDPRRYRWNMYDTDPTTDDTDNDRMEESWDPRPTIPDDRLDTSISLYRIGFPTPTGGLKWYWPEFGPGQQHPVSSVFAPTFVWSVALGDPNFPHDYFGFPYRIIDSTMNKGTTLYLEIIVGIEKGQPGADFFRKGWYNYLNVSVSFHNATIDVPPEEWGSVSENVSYDIDDDVDGDGIPMGADNSPVNPWLYTPNRAQYPMFALGLDDLNPLAIPEEMYFDEFNPSDYTLPELGITSDDFPGPDDPYVDPATGKGHSGFELPFVNVSQYPNPNTIRSGTYWFVWSSMTFYKIGFYFMIPEGVMAGWVCMDSVVTTDENIHVDESFEAFSGVLFGVNDGWPYVAY